MMNRTKMLSIGLAAAAANTSCRDSAKDDRSDYVLQARSAAKETSAVASDMPASPPAANAAMTLDEGKMGEMGGPGGGRQDALKRKLDASKRKPAKPLVLGTKAENDADNQRANGEAVATRSWFPETFLFEPLVVTDDAGDATVAVKVPDRLTNWRVLALAHSRQGAQAGATTSFAGTLPIYVDPVIPAFLTAGDKIRLPVQLVNTTDAAVTAKLESAIEGATLTGIGGTKTVPSGGSVIDYAELHAPRSGQIKLGVRLAGNDAVMRTIEVVPSGRPVTVTRGGTLAAPRSLTLNGARGEDPATDRARLLVYPGALAIVRSELAVSVARSGVADDAYALLLAGRAGQLLAALGEKADPKATRELAIVTGQRVIHHARTLDVVRASAIAEAALAHADNPVMERLAERAGDFLAKAQLPDGTFAGATGWTLQRMLVLTASATRAAIADQSTADARKRAKAVRSRAAGAFARMFEQASDAYTAAAILASGAIATDDPLASKLRRAVIDGIAPNEDGSKYLEVKPGVTRADGTVPSRAEAAALAVRALGSDAKDAPVADLGATVLAAYSPVFGWGDGTANLECLRAVSELFKAPLPRSVKITLAVDGTPISSGQFDAAQLKDVLSLEGSLPSGFAGDHAWTISSEPAVPGLGFVLSLDAWTAWQTETTKSGLELALAPTVKGQVGKPIELTVTAVAPSGMPVRIHHALPAGVQVDRPSLEALVASGAITRFETADGKVDLYVAALQPGQTLNAKYKVIPTLAGTLRAQASWVEASATTFHVPPAQWTVSP